MKRMTMSMTMAKKNGCVKVGCDNGCPTERASCQIG